MNKGLVGCLIVAIVAGIGGLVGAYYFIWRPAKAYVVDFAKLQELPKLNQQVRNTTAFMPPGDNVLTNDGVERFVRTQKAIQGKLGQRVEELHVKYEQLTKGRADYKPSWAELTNAYRDLAGLIVEAKRAQVEALNQNKFSLAEYGWIRQRIYEAAGIPISADFEKILRGLAAGNKPTTENQPSNATRPSVAVPERNRALIAPYTKELTERAGLAAFGL